MLRPSAPARRVIGLTLGVGLASGIGLGAYTLGSSAGANSSYLPRVASATSTGQTALDEPGSPAAVSPAEASASSPLTLEEATAVAIEAAAPGRVVQWDEDHEPTGLRYDVTLLHDDGSTTDVEVDTVTGRVTSIDHDEDGD